MWWKLAIGAALGVIVGYFGPWGYPLWIIVGLIVGYLADVIVRKKARPVSSQTKG